MKTKKVLGLDLGSASIGWALVEEANNNPSNILDMGVRVIPYDGTEGQEFLKGAGESRNAARTTKRSIRKGYDRYQLRRSTLVGFLSNKGITINNELKSLSKMELWKLRNDAASTKISLNELGRILLWLNQKRGYKSSRLDKNSDKKETEYVQEILSRDKILKEESLTIGQFFYNNLKQDPYFRVKENVFSRNSYINEYNAILNCQKNYYPNIINDDFINTIRDSIIYYQRPLKSQKGLVSLCEFESKTLKTEDGKIYKTGPKVAPKSSPIFQLSKIWETVNNIEYKDNNGTKYSLSLEEKKKVIEWLDNNEKLTLTKLISILGLRQSEYFFSKQIEKGLNGNTTKCQLQKFIKDKNLQNKLLRFNIEINTTDEEVSLVDKKTGELTYATNRVVIVNKLENEPLYRLWHIIYSIPEKENCIQSIKNLFNELNDGEPVDEQTAHALSEINFSHSGFANKSAKCIKKTLPYLMQGHLYSQSMELAGYNHSNSLTKEERDSNEKKEFLELLPKNSLRQPIVEKILNQMINLVNSIIEKHGKLDEIRVELARELKQSKDERNDSMKFMNKLEKENDEFKRRISEMGVSPTRRNLIKYRLLVEAKEQDLNKLNATCIYCGQPIGISQALNGELVDVDHIIPKAKLFNDSQSNKVLVHRKCNATKGDSTAYDFMKSKSEEVFLAYIERVKQLANSGVISKSKRDNLLTPEEKIPQNFIERQLRETQYISKKSREILEKVCSKVWSTSGTITSQLRKLWGWEDALRQLNYQKYAEANLIIEKEWTSQHGSKNHKAITLVGWTKRDDQRHHALDALTIACTKQSFIQKINTLNASSTRDEMLKNIEGNVFNEKLTLLEKYLTRNCPFDTEFVAEKLSKILVSIKSGKKVAVWGTRKIIKEGKKHVIQKNILVPRGPLSEESVYGKIKKKERVPTKNLFERINDIENKEIRAIIQNRLVEQGNDIKKAQKSLGKYPLFLDENKELVLESAICFCEETVIKYKVDINFGKVDKVVDKEIKSILLKRLVKFENKPKEAFKDQTNSEGKTIKWYEDEGLNRPIHSVRCFTGLNSIVPIKYSDNKPISFVKPGNNHHVAIYQKPDGSLVENICSFWHAVERKKFNIPTIIHSSNEIWDNILKHKELPSAFLEQLPPPNLNLFLTLQINEMVLLGLSRDEAEIAITSNQKEILSKHLYRVQKLSSSDYYFRHHIETNSEEGKDHITLKKYFRINSLKSFQNLNPIKIRINIIGEYGKI
jgi:CRISPR-associated endonuclease Csn1